MDAIPQSSTLFVEVQSLDHFYHQLDQNSLWNNLLKIQRFENFGTKLRQFDSLLHLKVGNNNILAEQKAILSVHPGQDKINLLLTINLSGNLKKKFLRGILNQIYGESFTSLKTTVDGVAINKLVFNQHEKSFSYFTLGGLFVGSTSHELVVESLNELKNKSDFKTSSSFLEVSKTAGKKVDANIYLNYRQFPSFLNLLCDGASSNQKLFFSNLADWSGLDLILKKDEILLSGFTKAVDSTHKFIQLFKGQDPQTFEMASVIPENATFLLHLGINKFNEYFAGYQNFKVENDSSISLRKKIEKLDKVLKSNAEKLFIPFVGSEIALVSLATNAASYEDNSYALIKIKNQQRINAYLNKLTRDNAGSGRIKEYRDYTLNRINVEDFIPMVFGDAFNVIQKFYYTIFNNYLLVANSNQAIEKYINLYLGGQTLNLNPDFISFSDNMAETSNFYFYFNPNKGLNLLEEFTTPAIYQFLIQNALTIKNYQAFGIQYAQQTNGLFTNLAINYQVKSEVKNNWIWKARLDDQIYGKPKLVKNHQNQFHYTLTTDVQDQVSLFDQHGNRLWKQVLDGPVLGEVYEVDYFKNGKIQYLFNTQNSIYLLDVLGRAVGNFPLKLKVQASNGIALFDYSNNMDYRIVYGGTDRKIYNYNIKGAEVPGWTKSQTTSLLESEIQHLVGNNRDYILLADKAGTIRILSRRGKDRILLKTQFIKAKYAKFYVNTTNKKGLFITTNNTGKLSYIKSNGNLEYSDFGNYSADHYFFYEDFDKDGHPDFIYLDGKTLKVFNRFKEVLLHFDFPYEILGPPQIFKAKDGTCTIAICDGEQKIYLFDVDGQIEHSQDEAGNLEFSLADLLQNGSLNLLLGSDKSIRNYVVR